MKKQKGKIEKLDTDEIGVFILSPIYHCETREKINEIIEALNKLMEKTHEKTKTKEN